MFRPPLLKTIDDLLVGIENIAPERVEKLAALGAYIERRRAEGGLIQLEFVCTHNSRRSQLAQVWAKTAADYFGVSQVVCFSAGTEVTALNPRAAASLERAGFLVKNPGGNNPRYEISTHEEEEPVVCFSKLIDDPENPSTDFAAVMTCAEADAACPVVLGAERISLPYLDPKVADDTPREAAVYDERSAQIATEMLAVFGAVELGV